MGKASKVHYRTKYDGEKDIVTLITISGTRRRVEHIPVMIFCQGSKGPLWNSYSLSMLSEKAKSLIGACIVRNLTEEQKKAREIFLESFLAKGAVGRCCDWAGAAEWTCSQMDMGIETAWRLFPNPNHELEKRYKYIRGW